MITYEYMTGVKNSEILLAHILTQTSLIIIHVSVIMILFFPIWDLKCEGSYFHVFIIMLMDGLTGLMYGKYFTQYVERNVSNNKKNCYK